jgi:hypothetical protein
MPIISRNRIKFDENMEELKPEKFGINCLKKTDSKTRFNQHDDDSSYKFWILTVLFVLLPSILIAKSQLIKLNFDRPIKANFIELDLFSLSRGFISNNFVPFFKDCPN